MARESLSSPAPTAIPKFVTASDTVDLPNGVCRGLLVGTAGAARIMDAEGTDTGATNLIPLQAGYNPVGAKRVFSTGLTASNIWALY